MFGGCADCNWAGSTGLESLTCRLLLCVVWPKYPRVDRSVGRPFPIFASFGHEDVNDHVRASRSNERGQSSTKQEVCDRHKESNQLGYDQRVLINKCGICPKRTRSWGFDSLRSVHKRKRQRETEDCSGWQQHNLNASGSQTNLSTAEGLLCVVWGLYGAWGSHRSRCRH